ncbi:hypothetical protein [Amycolatopsis sp. H20-H5]|uniref:hypothetical protein n=1 Tax=Amycolatopsis sp. H20-H5 TaxID=3046309 RepID=UPI002DB6E3F6|nr:hypothetical protein [Amycolatopsis sp. H20-H5]MEC3975972.1 hypothetical protein [Amycolatopsis sp. H20-H5]
MSARILRIELRRSIAPWAGLAILLVAAGFTYFFSGPWWKGSAAWNLQWTSVTVWLRYLLVFLWPLSVGAGALQGLRDHRSGMSELVSTTPRPAWQRAGTTALALVLMQFAGYLVFFVGGAMQVMGNASYAHLGWLPILFVGLLALVAGGWLGMGLGRSLPFALTPPVLAVLSLVGMIFLSLATASGSAVETLLPGRAVLLSPVLPQPRDAFSTIAGSVSLGQAVWLIGVAATGFLLLMAGSVRARALALVPVALGAAIALPVLPAENADTFVFDAGASAQVCSGQICVRKVHETRLGMLTGPGQEALRLLAKLPGAPTSVRETLYPQLLHGIQPRTADVVSVDFDDWRFRGATGEVLTRSLLAGAGTPSCFGTSDGRNDRDDALRDQAARSVAAGWLLGDRELELVKHYSLDRPMIDALAQPVWKALRALPPEEQQARIAALRAASLSCHGDLLAVLAR